MKRAIIMSAKYAPGHFSHMLAYTKLFENAGFETSMLIANEYIDFINDYPEYKYISLEDIKSVKADILLIYNMSVHDSKYMRILKKNNQNLKILFVYHEPWFGLKKWLEDLKTKRESVIDSTKTLARYFFAVSIIKKSDKILLPSRKAEEYYNKICIKYNPNYSLFPLVFTDEANGSYSIEDKKYFSFISTVQNSKNFTMFLKYIKYKAKSDQSSLFQIATRSDISEYLDDELNQLIKQKRLIINHGHSLSNQEINKAYAVSNCTWMLYNRSTQSGVLCKSFMFGSPVIASDIGSFREVVNKNNGIILNNGYSLEDIDKAYEQIRNAQAQLSDGARAAFISDFYYASHSENFEKIIR